MEKKIPHAKPKLTNSEIDRFLKHLEEERQMLDDHGQTIIGRRDRPPNLEDSMKEYHPR